MSQPYGVGTRDCELAFGELTRKEKNLAGSRREPAIPPYLQKGEEKVS
jgi:hypothetical protein